MEADATCDYVPWPSKLVRFGKEGRPGLPAWGLGSTQGASSDSHPSSVEGAIVLDAVGATCRSNWPLPPGLEGSQSGGCSFQANGACWADQAVKLTYEEECVAARSTSEGSHFGEEEADESQGAPTPRSNANIFPTATPANQQEDGAERLSRISALQELVQSARNCQLPSSAVVLQWHFDIRLAGGDSEFRAVVAFLFDGLPHNIAGSWKPSKVRAKRDTAERTLVLFTECWGYPPQPEDNFQQLLHANGVISEVDILRVLCARHPDRFGGQPVVSHAVEQEGFRATISLDIFGAPHTFPGAVCETEVAASLDAAARVLWYVQCPGFEREFSIDVDDTKVLATKIPDPITPWRRTYSPEAAPTDPVEMAPEDRRVLEITVAYVRDCLRRVYGEPSSEERNLWKWTYNFKAKRRGPAQLARATVHVRNGLSFRSAWCDTRDKAKLDVCWKILVALQSDAAGVLGNIERVVMLNL